MKKLIIFLAFAFSVISLSAQTTYPVGGVPRLIAGTAADTLTASATKSYIFDFGTSISKGLGTSIQIWTDLVSGTATFGYKYWWSNDAVNFPATAADSLTSAKSHASDYTKVLYIDSLQGRYLKLSLIATSATQKSKIYLYPWAWDK